MYEQGRREPDSTTLSKICRTLDASGNYVLNLDENIGGSKKSNYENKEIYGVISEFINDLEHQENLMFNGEPINNFEKKKIVLEIDSKNSSAIDELNKL